MGYSLTAEPFCFLCEDRGKKCVFLGLGSQHWWSLLPAGRGAKLGEPSWEVGAWGSSSGSTTCSHLLCDFRYATPSLWAQHAKPPSLRYLLALTVSEFRVSASGPEWSSKTTSRVETLEEGKGNQGRLLGGRGMRTQTQRLSASTLPLLHLHSQGPLPLSAEP